MRSFQPYLNAGGDTSSVAAIAIHQNRSPRRTCALSTGASSEGNDVTWYRAKFPGSTQSHALMHTTAATKQAWASWEARRALSFVAVRSSPLSSVESSNAVSKSTTRRPQAAFSVSHRASSTPALVSAVHTIGSSSRHHHDAAAVSTEADAPNGRAPVARSDAHTSAMTASMMAPADASDRRWSQFWYACSTSGSANLNHSVRHLPSSSDPSSAAESVLVLSAPVTVSPDCWCSGAGRWAGTPRIVPSGSA
mmetsp:Transcript_53075/g.163375  ORF Transcript_53075/g.163375 Transcript_53075/m.163375 type:complete len:251 (-) Transcript_53075:286-1038(-)